MEKYLPHLRGCSFREEIALALPKVKNVEELARECAMSVNTLGRRFKEELNTTPHRWLTEQRKAHVTSLLADTDMPFKRLRRVRLRHSELPVGLLQEAPEGYSCRNP